MSPERSWRRHLLDMIEAAEEIQRFVAGMSEEEFFADAKTMKAAFHDLTIIGEASRHVPEEIVAPYPEVPWPSIWRMRNFLTHVYFGVKRDVVWETIQDDLPVLLETCRKILAEHSDAEPPAAS